MVSLYRDPTGKFIMGERRNSVTGNKMSGLSDVESRTVESKQTQMELRIQELEKVVRSYEVGYNYVHYIRTYLSQVMLVCFYRVIYVSVKKR